MITVQSGKNFIRLIQDDKWQFTYRQPGVYMVDGYRYTVDHIIQQRKSPGPHGQWHTHKLPRWLEIA